MYIGLTHLHSGLRYVVLAILVATIAKAYGGLKSGKAYEKSDNLLSLFSMIALHLQLLIGIALYFLSPLAQPGAMGEAMKDPMLRFFTVEHALMMLVGIAIVTAGRISSKKTEEAALKHSRVFKFYLAGLLVILVSIPWPFLKSFGSWF